MKENMFDVLIYLFENYLEDEVILFPDSDSIRGELLDAGFAQLEVNKAFAWLESLTAQTSVIHMNASFRIFSSAEKAKLDTECIDLLMFLEHNGVLSPTNREKVIDSAMAIEVENINLDELKWIILMVLLSQTDDEAEFLRMENMIYAHNPSYLH